ncbi:MAG TPA: class I SAM-dependent methyltransferase [Clostridiales bacterium]|nr:class I SAM-dependent methyltransferase [Clostridiales bacterium]
MVESKEWDWKEADKTVWTDPCEESYYYVNKWRSEGKKSVLDLGCGLGRHAILFAKEGFDVTAVDLSEEGIDYLNKWKKIDDLKIITKVCDMKQLPFQNNSFDCIWSYHVISHTDTEGFLTILEEIKRVLKPKGSIYFTLCSKETWSYSEAGFPPVDENTIIKTEGPEKNVPHYYVELDDIERLLHSDFTIIRIRHIDDCYFAGSKQNSKHYYIEAVKKPNG